MKKYACAVLLATVAWPALATEVGVSVQISQPGVYGRIDIGRFPQPVVIAPQPVIITGPVVGRPPGQPAYLWVPPGHQKKWSKHCKEYNACGVPVYFVKDDWYQQHVMAPQDGKGHGKNKDKGKGKSD